MKLKFKLQPHQSAAVAAVLDCFAGQLQPEQRGPRRAPDPGAGDGEALGLANAALTLSPDQLLANIRAVQRRNQLAESECLVPSTACPLNLDVEMETGTGKTYCYLKTVFELHQRYGWRKFIAVVPSIAIREGVLQALALTAEHFAERYGRRLRFFAYSSKQMHKLENFAADGGINLMVINIQAFNAAGKDQRRIYEALDDFQSRRPIDVLRATRPILILDEPQKMEGHKTLAALARFEPLLILRYSATHRTEHNLVFRLDALDAYTQKLVKKIAVRGVTFSGQGAYLYLESIEWSPHAPLARLELEVRQGEAVQRRTKRLVQGQDLLAVSNGLEAYHGYVITEIDADQGAVAFANGVVLRTGEAVADDSELTLRRLQIREAIKAHLERERLLFARGIKVLSLFFIDGVVKYRDYAALDERGAYARLFEDEYGRLVAERLGELTADETAYHRYLAGIQVGQTHCGYFAVDRKSKRLKDPSIKTRGGGADLSDDVDAYQLILRDKQRLLSLAEPVRFLFSHSALREGWDNPNVFVLCMLKHSFNTTTRRQEVGRGLRLCVDQRGERMDDPETAHQLNLLTVVASESYRDFVTALQRELSAALADRRPGRPSPRQLPEVLDGRMTQPAPAREVLAASPPPARLLGTAEVAPLLNACVSALNRELRVAPLHYTVQSSTQAVWGSRSDSLESETVVEQPVVATLRHDLLGRIADATQLTRKAVAAILCAIEPAVFDQYRHNPERFVGECQRLMQRQLATFQSALEE